MIQFTKTSNGFLVAFSGNELFLDEGTISLPFNALSLTIDESNIATFRKSSNGDVFFSGLIKNIIFGETTATKQTISGLFSDICCLPPGGGSSDLENRVEALETTVGDSTSGLVKDVDDLDDSVSTISSSVSSLQTTVGNSTSGLVKDVDDLQTAVGDSNSGLVHDVSGLSTSVGSLETTVGDNNSGLVKAVNDLETTVGDSTAGLVHDVSTMSSSVSSLQTTVGDSNSGLVKDVNDLETTVGDNERVTSEALTSLRTIILDNEQTTSEALTELRRLIAGISDTVDGLNLRLTQAESEITTLDTVMSAAVNQLS